jgi:CDP-glycerol glycerophosphotransferase (TagB/SpsB family)
LAIDLAGFYVMPKVGDFQAVWGQYYRKWHIDRGKPPETQVATGFPGHDGLHNLPPIDREVVCKRFGLDPGFKVVLVATEWFQAGSSRYTVEEEENYIRHVLRSLKIHDDIQIVVKLHPAHQYKYNKIVSQIAEQERVRVVIARDSLWDLMRLSSFVIVSMSSVCVEALILGKRVISVNLNDCRDITGLVQDGLAIGAYSVEEIKLAIETCMEVAEQNPNQDDRNRKLLLPFIYLDDGCASNRVADLIRTKSI